MKFEKARLFSGGRDENASCKQNSKKEEMRTVICEITYKIKHFNEGPLPDGDHVQGIRLYFPMSNKKLSCNHIYHYCKHIKTKPFVLHFHILLDALKGFLRSLS